MHQKNTRRLPLQSLTTLQPLTKSKCEMSDHDYITKIYLFSAFPHLTYEIKVHTAEEIKPVGEGQFSKTWAPQQRNEDRRNSHQL